MIMILHRIQTFITHSILAITLSSVIFACSDDGFESQNRVNDQFISFNVRTESGEMPLTRGGYSSIVHTSIPIISESSDSLFIIAEERITGENEKATRGAATTLENIESFGVYATLSASGELYMKNIPVSENSGVWIPQKEYLWPGDESLHFIGYSPFNGNPGAEGITSLPGTSGTEITDHIIGFLTPGEVSDQFDFLRAVPKDASSSPCNLTFSHALTGIRFAAGKELTACKIKGISLSGILSKGNFDLESGEWTDISDPQTFSMEPELSLEAAQGSSFVTPETPLTDETMFLIPQTLGENAEVSVIIEKDGIASTFHGSLAGQVWTSGKTITYHISANPVTSALIFEALDENGNRISQLSSDYYGGEHRFTIVSQYNDPNTGTESPVDWTATLIDSNGKEMEIPDWVTISTLTGSGNVEDTISTGMPAPVFININQHSQNLQNAEDINLTSGHSRYNLASSSGAETDENTANCYVINAPGKYSFPLVYGNAIENGTTNSSSYISTVRKSAAHNKNTLYHFINHLGNEVTDPYIYNNPDCTPAKADVIWQDGADLVRNVILSDDKKSVQFEISQAAIRQGNALIGVTDNSGTLMWSWHIWITDMKPEESMISIPNQNNSSLIYYLASCNVGHIYGGDEIEFTPEDFTLRFVQQNVPDGEEPLSLDIKFSQKSLSTSMSECHPFYQWGRKDPLLGSIKYYFDSSNIMHQSVTTTQAFDTDNSIQIANSIKNPVVFYTGIEDTLTGMNPFYGNLWNINLKSSSESTNNQNIKTIYDPCPVGTKVPIGDAFLVLRHFKSNQVEGTNTKTVSVPGASQEIEFTALGYLMYNDGKFTMAEDDSDHIGPCCIWAATAGGRAGVAHYLVFNNNGDIYDETFVATLGYGVRPAKE